MDQDSEASVATRRQLKLTDTPLKITAIYAIIGGLWILFSDQLLAALVSDPVTFMRLGMLKGWFYVIAIAGLLYVLIRRAGEAQRASEQRHRQMLEERVEMRTRELSTLLEVSQNVASTLDLGSLMDGLEATRRIKSQWPEIRVIGLSMYPVYRAQAHAAGADVFLLKGCTAEELQAAIVAAV